MKNTILSVFLFVTFFSFSQNTYTVDNRADSIADYTNLQTAINEVPNGSVLLIQGSSINYGDIIVNKKITIKGTGFFLDENPKTQSTNYVSRVREINIKEGVNDVLLTGLFIREIIFDKNVSDTKIYMNFLLQIRKNDDFTADDTKLIGNYFSGFNAVIELGENSLIKGNIINSNTILGNKLEITNNYIKSYQINNIENSVIKNNIFTTPYYKNSSNIYKNNIFQGSSNITDEDDNIFIKYDDIDDLFITSSDPRYSTDGKRILRDGAIAISAGLNGEDIGAFGGGYVLSGIPDIPNIYEFTVPTTGNVNGKIQVKIKVKSNN